MADGDGHDARDGTVRWGGRYWCIKTDISADGEIYLMADRMEVAPSGALVAWGGYRPVDGLPDGELPLLTVAPGRWTAVYAASLLDGAAVAVEHWKGEVLPRKDQHGRGVGAAFDAG